MTRRAFQGDVEFEATSFDGHASFSEATFRRQAWFGHTNFTGHAFFDEATFQGPAEFYNATFNRDAHFGGATFEGPAEFEGIICRQANFTDTTFRQAHQLGPVLARRSMVLDGAIFQERVLVDVSAAALCCRRTRFLAGVQLRVRWADVTMDDADLAAPSILSGGDNPFLDEDRWAQAMRRLPGRPPHREHAQAGLAASSGRSRLEGGNGGPARVPVLRRPQP